MVAVGRWLKRVRWPRAAVLFVGALVVLAAGTWAIVPGVVHITAPTYVEDPRDFPDGSAATQLASIEITCPPLFGAFESRVDAAARMAGEQSPPGSLAREYNDQRSAACAEAQRRHLLAGATAVGAGFVITGALGWLLRGRGSTVVVPRPVWAGTTPRVEGEDRPAGCRLCERALPERPALMLADLDGSARLCQRCLVQRRVHASVIELVVSVVCIVVGLVAAAAGGVGDIAGALLVVGSIAPLLYAQVAPHEAGHAIVARVMGIRVLDVIVGIGPALASFSVGSTRVTIQALPASGRTMLAGVSTSWYRLRLWLAVAGGPAVSVGIIVLAYYWDPGTTGPASVARTMVMGSAAWILISNLVPMELHGIEGVSHSDGWQLTRIPVLSKPAIEARVVTSRANIALHDARRHHSPPALSEQDRVRLDQASGQGDPQARLVRCHLLLADRDWDAAADAARDLLADTDASAPGRAHLLNIVAWCHVVNRPVQADDEADRCSRQAFLLEPDDAAIAGTRGSVLIEIGEPEKGIELLRQSLRTNYDNTDQALIYSYLAIGEAACGIQEQAAATLATVERLDPTCYLLDRVRDRVDRTPPPDNRPNAT